MIKSQKFVRMMIRNTLNHSFSLSKFNKNSFSSIIRLDNSLPGGLKHLNLKNGNENDSNNNKNVNENDENKLRWYSCGPTVYDVAHLGHARTYICTDIIRRILINYFNFELHFAMGVTDIDDKIIARAKSDNLHDWKDILKMVRKLENDFLKDMDELKVLRPDNLLRVTEHMDEIINYVSKLVEDDKAYVTKSGDVYFDCKKLGTNYGKLGPIPPKSTSEVGETEGDITTGKRNWRDFALWKSSDIDEPSWSSPWGKGRPGWHIECSTMIQSTFGRNLDIHSGGIDLKFPHHTNEIAQAEAYNSCGCNNESNWVKYWIHTGHLYIKGRKMSKSEKNFISVREYLNGNWTKNPSADLRIFFLQHKYNSTLHFSKERVEEAAIFRRKIETFLERALDIYDNDSNTNEEKPSLESEKLLCCLEECRQGIRSAFMNDFDTPKALSNILSLVNHSNRYLVDVEKEQEPIQPILSVYNFIINTLNILGVSINNCNEDKIISQRGQDINIMNRDAIDSFVDFRSEVRNASLQALKLSSKIFIDVADDNSNIELKIGLQEQLNKLLSACDDAREAASKHMNIRIDDRKGNTKWYKDN